MSDLRDAATKVCVMDWAELETWNENRSKHEDTLANYCFVSTFAYAMLTTGYGFHLEVSK